MKKGLLEINELPGVWGSILCSNQSELVESSPPKSFDKSTQEDICRHSIELLSSAEKSVAGLREVVIHYSERKLFVLDLEQVVLIVFCTPSVDISLLRMTINVITTRWKSDKKIQKRMNANSVRRR